MRIINLSFAYVSTHNDPDLWVKKIGFATGVLESLSKFAEVIGIYNINYRGVLLRNGVTYRFPRYTRLELLFPLSYNRFIKKLAPDAVIIHGLNSPWQVIMLRWQVGKKIKIIVQHHAERPFQDVRRYLQRWADRYVHAYLFSARDLGQQWVDKGQIRSIKKIEEVLGSSSSFFVVDKEVARAKVNVTGETVFLWVGGLDTNKNPLLVLRTFIRFLKIYPTARLYMIFQTFQLLGEVKRILANGDIDNGSIFLVGTVDNAELLFWYNSADFIISSSHYESAGIAVCEAFSCGCIPILTDIPSFRMMTDNGRLGWLYPAGNEEALLDVLVTSMAANRQGLKESVLLQFKRKLSFDANAISIMGVVSAN